MPMFPIPSSSMWALLAAAAIIRLSTSSSLHHRQPNSSFSPESPAITVIVTSTDGTDITPGFQTLLYVPEVVSLSNLTGRSLGERQVLGGRLMNTCHSQPSDFKWSKCNHFGDPFDLRRYDVKCFLTAVTQTSRRLRLITEEGSCTAEEICVDGPIDRRGHPTIASCVRRSSYKPHSQFHVSPPMKQLLQEGWRANAIVSDGDGDKALNASSLEISTGATGSRTDGQEVTPTTQQTCTDCVGLETDEFAEGTDFLEAQVKVAAGVATVGIVWLTLLSG